MLRKVISIIFIGISLFIVYSENHSVNEYRDNVDNVISSKNDTKIYDGYIRIPVLDYNGVIKSGDYNKVLDSNLVLMISDERLFDENNGNIILAGHNNKYVFSKLYKLKIDDEIIISNFDNEYSYTVYNVEYINIKDKTILDNIYDKKILTLITCTNNNQIRYVIRAKFDHIISNL